LLHYCDFASASQKEEEWEEGEKGEEVSEDPDCHRWNLHRRNVQGTGQIMALLDGECR
jgi:hypothetical protein